jgi:GAG-pre-integrase domain
LTISHIGSFCLVTNCHPLVLNNVLHVSSISKPLLSISQLVSDNNVVVEFHSFYCLIKDRETHQVLLQGTLFNGLYTVVSPVSHPRALQCDVVPFSTWHHRLAHASSTVLQHIAPLKYLSCKSNNIGVCSSCSQAKSHKLLFLSSKTTVHKPLEIVHCDLWGPSPIISSTGYRYYLLFTD